MERMYVQQARRLAGVGQTASDEPWQEEKHLFAHDWWVAFSGGFCHLLLKRRVLPTVAKHTRDGTSFRVGRTWVPSTSGVSVIMIAAAPCFALPPACSMPCRAATLTSVLPLVLRALCRLPS